MTEKINGPVLVTDGTGYIGSHTVLTLMDRGLKPVVLDNLSTGRRDLVPEDVPFVEGNAGESIWCGTFSANTAAGWPRT